MTDAGAMCDDFSRQIVRYNKNNKTALESVVYLPIEVDTSIQAVINVCVSEKDKTNNDKKTKIPPSTRGTTQSMSFPTNLPLEGSSMVSPTCDRDPIIIHPLSLTLLRLQVDLTGGLPSQ